nr:trichohyalin isoform X2 [Misgurnus anguillicaudatus]
MEIVDHEGSGENTDELLSAEVDDEVDVYELIPLGLSHDHCDRLLDAIDAQLNHIQTHSQFQMREGTSKRNEFSSSTGYLDRGLSLSKDTGLGSTVPTNDKTPSTPDWTPSEGKCAQAEHQTVEILKVTDVWHPYGDGLCSASRNEQCRWRLERLLGKSSEVAEIRNEEDELTMDSICTEDFLTRFRDEMIDPGKGVAPPPDVPTTSSDPADDNELSNSHTQHLSKTPIRQLTGIPMQSFDSITIDTDLDTVCSEKVQRYLKSALSKKTGTGFRFSRESVFSTGPAIQSNTQSFSSDDEETSGEGSVSKRYSRGRRHPPSRNGKKRSSHQSKRNLSYTSLERPRDQIRINEDQLKELKVSVAKLQQQKIAVVHTLGKLREEVDQTKTEQQSLQNIMRDSRAQAQNIRCELHQLQVQKDICLEEVRVLQEQQENLVQRSKMAQNYDISCHNCVGRSVSILERDEMDRLLDNAKSELFSEQRRFRHTIDSMQERMDEVIQEMEQKDEDFRSLQQKCISLEKQLADTIRETDRIKQSSQQDLKQQVSRFEVLEQTVAQKDLLLRGLEEEKKALHLELSSLREEHRLKLTELQNRIKKEKEQEINQLNLQLTKRHQEELQMMKDEEVKRLKGALDQHAGEMRRQAEELTSETQEKIEKALKQEERKWVEQREKALREQRGILEEQIEEAVKRGKVEVEKERRKTLELQSKVSELQKVSEQTEKDVVHLKESLQRSEQELRHLRAALSERDQKHQRRTARLERQIGNWAQDIHTECVSLQELLKNNGLTVESKHLTDSPTVPEALQALQYLTKATQRLINDLKNEISSQKRTAQHLSLDKERELHRQKEQMTEEKKQALASLKENLIQEHMKEMSGLCTTNMADANETDGLLARMHRQLQAKDDELKMVQKNMAEWKDKTPARLAHKFQLERTAGMDRRVAKPQAEQQKRLERLENEMRHLTGCRDHKESQLSSTALQSGPDFQQSPNTKDLTSYKLLQHLQSRIRQLKESQARCPSPVKWDRDDRKLGGSYLDTIAPAQECCKTEGCIPTRTSCS